MEDMVERARRGETRSWYRVPSKGVTSKQKLIAAAVDDEGWQKIRHSMKGTTTLKKLQVCFDYWNSGDHLRLVIDEYDAGEEHDAAQCYVCIRVENYLGALCRGGQLSAGARLQDLLNGECVVLK